MLIEEEIKSTTDINPDILEAVFEEGAIIEEDEVAFFTPNDDQSDEIDIPFQANDEGYW